MMRAAYRAVTGLAGPPLRAWLAWRSLHGKEDPARVKERRGYATHPRPEGRLAWFHGASVGEALSLLPLIEAAKAAGWQVLVTTGTVTSAALLAGRLPPGCIHQFLPLDKTAWVRRFFDYWRPALVLWAESELWPNTLHEMARRDIPAVLLNARLSDRAFRGWGRWKGVAADVLAPFSLILAQSALDQDRFAALGARNVHAVGNIKFAAAPLPADEAALASLREACAGRPIWLAASIHPGEDAIVAETHKRLMKNVPGLLTIIVPRHANKGSAMAEAATAAGLHAAVRTAAPAPARDTDIYVADTMGELGLFYRLCDTVFMGKSFTVGGGQNPAEPALIGCALVFGPDMSNFRTIAQDLTAAGAALQIARRDALADTIQTLLQDAAARTSMIEAGRRIMAGHANAVHETLAALAPYLQAPDKIR